MSKERVETFSDAVFAIILTLLVLELHAPDIAAHSSLSQYAVAMVPLIPKVVSFVLTFVMILYPLGGSSLSFPSFEPHNPWISLVE